MIVNGTYKRMREFFFEDPFFTKRRKIEERHGLSGLPEEIQLHILEMLSPHKLYFDISLVCKPWKKLLCRLFVNLYPLENAKIRYKRDQIKRWETFAEEQTARVNNKIRNLQCNRMIAGTVTLLGTAAVWPFSPVLSVGLSVGLVPAAVEGVKLFEGRRSFEYYQAKKQDIKETFEQNRQQLVTGDLKKLYDLDDGYFLDL